MASRKVVSWRTWSHSELKKYTSPANPSIAVLVHFGVEPFRVSSCRCALQATTRSTTLCSRVEIRCRTFICWNIPPRSAWKESQMERGERERMVGKTSRYRFALVPCFATELERKISFLTDLWGSYDVRMGRKEGPDLTFTLGQKWTATQPLISIFGKSIATRTRTGS